MEIENIPINEIKVKEQPRKTIDESSIRELAISIKSEGLINPIEIDENDKLITGERRLRAYQYLNERSNNRGHSFSRIPCIRRDIYGDIPVFRRQMQENLQREDIPPLELAQALKEYKERFIRTNIQVAKEIFGSGHREKKVRRLLHLLGADEEVRKGVRAGKISISHADDLLSLNSCPKEQKRLTRKVIEEDLSVPELRAEIKKVRNPNLESHVILVTAESGINWVRDMKVILAPFTETFFSDTECVTGRIQSCKLVAAK